MARDIFVGPRNEEGGALSFFVAIAESKAAGVELESSRGGVQHFIAYV
jgi:hypothetical protein